MARNNIFAIIIAMFQVQMILESSKGALCCSYSYNIMFWLILFDEAMV